MKSGIAGAAFAASFLATSASVALDQALPPYNAVNGIAGQLKSVGSDTLNNQMELWAEGFRRISRGKNCHRGQRFSDGAAGTSRREFAVRTDVATDDECRNRRL
jgi:ABC-type phosphate transport system substrate-binding protein